MFKPVYFTLQLRTAEEKEKGEEEGLVPLYKFFCQGTRNTCNPAGVPSGKTMKIHGHRMPHDAILLSSYSLVLTFLMCLHNLVTTGIKELMYFKSKLLICFHLFQDSWGEIKSQTWFIMLLHNGQYQYNRGTGASTSRCWKEVSRTVSFGGYEPD